MKISVSFLGVAWQNSVGPIPSVSVDIVAGQERMAVARSSVSCDALHCTHGRNASGTDSTALPFNASIAALSPFP